MSAIGNRRLLNELRELARVSAEAESGVAWLRDEDLRGFISVLRPFLTACEREESRRGGVFQSRQVH